MGSLTRRLNRARKPRKNRPTATRPVPEPPPPAIEDRLLSPEEYIERMRTAKAKGVRNAILTFGPDGDLKELDPTNPSHREEIAALGCECPICQEILDPKKEQKEKKKPRFLPWRGGKAA